MTDRPHVLLVTVDQWSASLLGCAEHPVLKTPTLDQCARNGVRYRSAYSECPVCIPARRTLMTGTTPRTHGDRVFQERLPMPDGIPTLAQTFRDNGYQATAVGKLHVYPQRDRVGFDDVILDEEGRLQFGVVDDYELYLGDEGYTGRQFEHGMSNNEYSVRPWHLPEETHPTSWATRNMVRAIKRRDPKRPAFWYLSYRHPHPPIVPIQPYLDMYRDAGIEPPYHGAWADEPELPYAVEAGRGVQRHLTDDDSINARRGFYALCTHIDHQLRVVMGTLREEGILDNTVICFTSDHGDMLGNHGLWAKRLFYEESAHIPMILVPPAGEDRLANGTVDDRIVGLQDVMPTLLDLAGLEIPTTVEGESMLTDSHREYFYGEIGEGPTATRMIRSNRHKLIYYPVGNHVQLFDLENDPLELEDVAVSNPQMTSALTDLLIENLVGEDAGYVRNGSLVGLPAQSFVASPNRGLSGQRGGHWPPPPESGKGFVSLIEG